MTGFQVVFFRLTGTYQIKINYNVSYDDQNEFFSIPEILKPPSGNLLLAFFITLHSENCFRVISIPIMIGSETVLNLK